MLQVSHPQQKGKPKIPAWWEKSIYLHKIECHVIIIVDETKIMWGWPWCTDVFESNFSPRYLMEKEGHQCVLDQYYSIKW